MTPPRLAHVVFMTRRYEEMIAWYQEVFGAWIVKPDLGATENGEVGVNHVAFTFASAGDLLENYERLKGAGITPYWPVHHGFTLSLYYQDPDGNRHEFQVESCGADEASAFMRSDLFAANPIGVGYDPEELLARYRAGASEAELLAPPNGSPSPVPVEHGNRSSVRVRFTAENTPP